MRSIIRSGVLVTVLVLCIASQPSQAAEHVTVSKVEQEGPTAGSEALSDSDAKLVAWARQELANPEDEDVNEDDNEDLPAAFAVPDETLAPSVHVALAKKTKSTSVLAGHHPALADAPADNAAPAPADNAAAADAGAAGGAASAASGSGSASAATPVGWFPPTDDWFDVPTNAPDALAVAGYVLDRYDEDRTFCDKGPAKSFTLLVAQKQLNVLGREKYLLVMLLGVREYQVHVEGYAEIEQHPMGLAGGPMADEVKKYRINFIDPPPCSEAEFNARLMSVPASTPELADAINALKLGWQAQHYQQFEGMTREHFAQQRLGLIMPEPTAMMPLTEKDMLAAAPVPDSFDARTQHADCRAFQPRDQGNCGSCYAMATAASLSARACILSNGKYDLNLSPQQMMDCTNGCEGGSADMIYKVLAVRGTIEEFCDPYTAKQGPCQSTCIDPNDHGYRWMVQAQTNYKWINTQTAKDQAESQMQLEVMQNGPAWLAFDVYSDFSQYAGGVYSKAPFATKSGGHAVMLIGWGVDNGKKYWLCQNSWGATWGEKGFFRIERGVNMANVEAYGINVASMATAGVCTQSSCQNGGSFNADCSCHCKKPWAGTLCRDCNLQCAAAGTLIKTASQCQCVCQLGYSGMHCEEGVSLSSSYQCVNSGVTIKAYWAFGDAPFQGSAVVVFKTNPAKPVYSPTTGWDTASKVGSSIFFCGSTPAKDQRCSSSGSVDLPQLSTAAAGNYSVYYCAHRGFNEFGQDRGYSVPTLIANIVVQSNPCDVSGLKTITSNADQRAHQQATDLPKYKSIDESKISPTDTSDTARVQLKVSSDIKLFTTAYQASFASTIANALDIEPAAVQILSVKSGSVIVDLQINEYGGQTALASAQMLNTMVSRRDPKISSLAIQSSVVESSASSMSHSIVLCLVASVFAVAVSVY